MNITERKYCDVCGEETIQIKENPEEHFEQECLPCGWNVWKDNWETEIEEYGFDKAKENWLDCRDGELNKEIVKELNASELAKWKQIVRWTNQHFGIANKNDDWKNEEDKAIDYKPYLIGGCIGGGIIAFIWLIVVLVRRD